LTQLLDIVDMESYNKYGEKGVSKKF